MSAVLEPAQTVTLSAPAQQTPGCAPRAPVLPCDLEVNRSGCWHKVMEFDAGSEAETHYVTTGAERLGLVDARVLFRIVVRGKPPRKVLQSYSQRYGWTLA